LTFSVEDFPASPSVSQDAGLETPTTVGSGLSSSESFALLDQHGSWLRTSQGYVQPRLDGSLEEYSQTWPRAGSMQSGIAYLRPPSALITRGTGSGSWLPTPQAFDANGGVLMNGGGNVKKWNGVNSLAGMARTGMWPTPTTQDAKNNGGPSQWERNSDPLNVAVQRMWPTPTSADGMGGPGNSGRDGGENLRTAVGGSLNPLFVEWLMGYPEGWTDLED
jgi:hypothetical protein